MFFSTAITLLAVLAQVHAAYVPIAKRYVNETVLTTTISNGAGADAAQTSLDPSAQAGPMQTTITSRFTVTYNPPASTTWASSILFNPSVAIVAAMAPVSVSNANISPSISTVYVPTTIYMTAPCAASTPSSEAAVLVNAAALTSYTTTNDPISSVSFSQPAASLINTPDGVQLAAVAVNVQVNGPYSNSTTTPDVTVHVTMTQQSTTTLYVPAPTA